MNYLVCFFTLFVLICPSVAQFLNQTFPDQFDAGLKRAPEINIEQSQGLLGISQEDGVDTIGGLFADGLSGREELAGFSTGDADASAGVNVGADFSGIFYDDAFQIDPVVTIPTYGTATPAEQTAAAQQIQDQFQQDLLGLFN
eukprot:TRINITY_DN2400_c0_g1_i18.p3 TRINITY_DN2400_c0_g1~~TRINITY_DN2400_c0_g1_i18.p3  ORF type:complete len:143 (+),score=29.25 TRINITY_DN2400_c0_g1_i18:166-594(+)